MVSPARASTRFPSKVKPTRAERSMRSPCCGGSQLTGRRSPPRGIRPRVLRLPLGLRPIEILGQRGPVHLVRARVALGDEPRPTARAVVPPLALHAGHVATEVVVGTQLAQR